MSDDHFWPSLPSYDDIITGEFRRQPKRMKSENKNVTEKSFNFNNINNNNNNRNIYEKENENNFNKIREKNQNQNLKLELEDGELADDSVFSDNKKFKYQKVKINDDGNSKAKQSKEVQNQSQKQQKKDKFQVKRQSNQNEQNSNKRPFSTSKKEESTLSRNNSSNDTTTTDKSVGKTPFVPRLVCRYFMEGICSKGDKCTFSHQVVPNKTVEEARVKDPCKFFIAGSCMKGESCYYSHDLSKVPCKFFHLKGECLMNGSVGGESESCRFSHDPIDAITLQKLREKEKERILNTQVHTPKVQTQLHNQGENSSINSSTSSSINSSVLIPSIFNASAQIHQDDTPIIDDTIAILNPFAEMDDDY